MSICSGKFLKKIGQLLCFVGLLPVLVEAQSSWQNLTVEYLQRNLARQDGGYGWEDQHDSHLTPTYAAIGVLYNLGKLPPNRDSLIAYIKSHHPQRGKNKEAGPSGTEERDLVYQQIQSLVWLNSDVSGFKDEVSGWQPQNNKVSNFEEHGYPVFLQEMMTPVCRGLLQLPLQSVAVHFTDYMRSRRRENGSYNNAPATEGGDGNILNTYWALRGQEQMADKMKQQTGDWIRLCQTANGGFTHQPNPSIGGNDDVAYTWAAIKGLQLISTEPARKTDCINYLISLRNSDGGFGKRPGLPSTPMSTFYAIDALNALQAFPALDSARFTTYPAEKVADLSGLSVFTVQFEASGGGSPAEAVMLADSLRIHLWGTKNSTVEWRAAAQKIADDKKVPVIFFQSDEAYGKSVSVAGQGTYSHIMDFIAPASANKKRELDGSSWQTYQKTFIEPLQNDNGALILQITNNEPLGRIILDESLNNSGFSAISTIHFGQNFSFWLPWLHQYRYQFPFIALQDAHGTQSWWWVNELAAYRTLFLGKTGSYEDLVKALKNNWVVAVRHDSISDYKTRLLGGAPGVQSFVLGKQNKWKWWRDGTAEIYQPWAAITVVNSKDPFELAAPDKGVNLRIRCWWNSVRQALKTPIVVLERLTVNGVVVKPEYVELKDNRGLISDSYYLYAIPGITNKKYVVEVTLKNLVSEQVRKSTKVFTYKDGRVL